MAQKMLIQFCLIFTFHMSSNLERNFMLFYQKILQFFLTALLVVGLYNSPSYAEDPGCSTVSVQFQEQDSQTYTDPADIKDNTVRFDNDPGDHRYYILIAKINTPIGSSKAINVTFNLINKNNDKISKTFATVSPAYEDNMGTATTSPLAVNNDLPTGQYYIQVVLQDASGNKAKFEDEGNFIRISSFKQNQFIIYTDSQTTYDTDNVVDFAPRHDVQYVSRIHNVNAVLVGFVGQRNCWQHVSGLEPIWENSATQQEILDTDGIYKYDYYFNEDYRAAHYDLNPTDYKDDTMECNLGDAVVGFYGAADDELDSLHIICQSLTDPSKPKYTIEMSPPNTPNSTIDHFGNNKTDWQFGDISNPNDQHPANCDQGTYISEVILRKYNKSHGPFFDPADAIKTIVGVCTEP